MIARLTRDVPARAAVLLSTLLMLLMFAPAVLDGYLLSVLILVLYFAYVGQAWNVMMGFAGQLSLGHSLYVGLGAYTAAALYVHFAIPALLGMLAGVALAVAAGLVVGALGFRFGVKGVYFALLTIAFAEFTRILFDHFAWIGGASGFFLPVVHGVNDPLRLRGSPVLFYYVILALTAIAFVLCHALMRTRLGYYWLAIREDPEAAEALGVDTLRYRLYAVALSAGMTAVGGVFYAFYYNNLYPEQIFSVARSIDLLLGPIIGGMGTLFGPILGAALLTVLGEATTYGLDRLGIAWPGAKQVAYGLVLLAIVLFAPNGVWPWLKRRLGVDAGRGPSDG
jgi:branched-chain amino acid transport system permease protein